MSLNHKPSFLSGKKRRLHRQLFANAYSNEQLQDNVNAILLMVLSEECLIVQIHTLLKMPLNLLHEDQHWMDTDNVHLIFPHGKPEIVQERAWMCWNQHTRQGCYKPDQQKRSLILLQIRSRSFLKQVQQLLVHFCFKLPSIFVCSKGLSSKSSLI